MPGVRFYLDSLLVFLRLVLEVGLYILIWSVLLRIYELDFYFERAILGPLCKTFVWLNPNRFCDAPPLASSNLLSLCGDLLIEFSLVLAIVLWFGDLTISVVTLGIYCVIPKFLWDFILVIDFLRPSNTFSFFKTLSCSSIVNYSTFSVVFLGLRWSILTKPWHSLSFRLSFCCRVCRTMPLLKIFSRSS